MKFDLKRQQQKSSLQVVKMGCRAPLPVYQVLLGPINGVYKFGSPSVNCARLSLLYFAAHFESRTVLLRYFSTLPVLITAG